MADATVSVILPVYNGARYLGACLDSVFAQTYRDFEVIVVDDGSTDETASICGDYSVRLIRQQNLGQAAARNRAVAESHGRYIAFIDHDDRWYPQRLERGVSSLEAEPTCALVYSDLDLTNEAGKVTQRGFLSARGDHPKRSLRDYLQGDMYVVPSTVTMRRSAFDTLRGFDESLRGYEDEHLFARLAATAPMCYLPESLVQWRQHPGGTTRRPVFFLSRIDYLRRLLAAFPDRPEQDEFLASRCIAPRFFDVYWSDYVSALAGHGPNVAPDEMRRGLLATLPYLGHQSFAVWLLAHTPYRIAGLVPWLWTRLPLPGPLRSSAWSWIQRRSHA